VDAYLLRVIIQTSTDDAEAIRCQYPAMQLVGLVLLVLLISYSLFDICFMATSDHRVKLEFILSYHVLPS
jgi:hypothetical protein